MLSYQHAYHAGNPADVLKHALWAELLHALRSKPKPLVAIDTHAGRGSYPLAATPELTRTQEYRQGLGKLKLADLPGAYGAVVRHLNPGGVLTELPGSPAVTVEGQRPADTVHLIERHPGELTHLQAWAHRRAGVQVHAADGFRHVLALVKGGQRTAVLIDPSYERLEEYAQVVDTVTTLLRRNPAAVFAVWLPELGLGKAKGAHQAVIDALKAAQVPATWLARWHWGLHADAIPTYALTGTAMLVLNLPYQLETTLPQILAPLAAGLGLPRKAQTYTLLVPRT